MTAICIFISIYVRVSNSLFVGILYKRYVGHLRLLTSSDVEENLEPRASRRSCRVIYTLIRGLHKICLIRLVLPEVEMSFVLRL